MGGLFFFTPPPSAKHCRGAASMLPRHHVRWQMLRFNSSRQATTAAFPDSQNLKSRRAPGRYDLSNRQSLPTFFDCKLLEAQRLTSC